MSKRTLFTLATLFTATLIVGYLFAQLRADGTISMESVESVVEWMKANPYKILVGAFAVVVGFGQLNDSFEMFGRVRRLFVRDAKEGEQIGVPDSDTERDRTRFLNKTHDIWIEQKYRKSLVEQIALQLNMTVQPNSERPHRLLDENGAAITVPIDHLFREKGESFLILGAPGSGKTTTLLTLAQSLIVEAQNDPRGDMARHVPTVNRVRTERPPLPIILNLSSYAQTAQKEDGASLVDWMAERLSKELSTPEPLTRGRIERREVVLLLDGLDEVAADHRPACVDAINAYVATYGGGLVVSCREKEFAELERLNITSAVVIKPFSADEIAGQLDKYPVDLRGIRQAVLASQNGIGAWAEMLSTPLTIGMAAIAFAGVPADQFVLEGDETEATTETTDEETGGSAALRQTLFQAYVRRMIHVHRPLDNLDKMEDAPRDALRYLRNLAHQMNRHELTTFYIEWLQPTWLLKKTKTPYQILGMLFVGLLNGVLSSLIGSLFVALSLGLSWVVPNVGALWSCFLDALENSLSISVIGSSVVSLFVGLDKKIILQEKVSWRLLNWKNLIRVINWKSNLITCSVFVLVFVTFILIFGVEYGLTSRINMGLNVGMRFGLFVLVILLVNDVIRAMRLLSKIDSDMREQPNQGVYSSVQNGVGFGLIISLCFALVIGLISGLIVGFRTTSGLKNSLFFAFGGGGVGMSFGLAVSTMFYGVGAVIKHYTLRWELTRQGMLPHGVSDKRLVAFLDRMTEPILLRRIGGGWQFVHRYLQDYFAQLSDEEIEAIARP